MNVKKFLIGWLVIAVVANVLDFVFHGAILSSTYKAMASDPLNGLRSDADVNKLWFVVLDVVGALVLSWFYQRMKAAITPGTSGGAMFGLAVGVLLAFPGFFFMPVMWRFPYWLTWAWVIAALVQYSIYGAILGMINTEKSAA
jgi:hypothetical protein